ncbi:hypothetical protein KVV02_005079 [Mortierella alpina]|uniref:Oligopeptide transporter n=1 Tax=Mortierella alpina TaxID=64518 RepID=A0A9P7ZZC7_MORAP|nr:hypothetical protein KVV02_005079 [Mortierella alpina]
MDKSEVFNEKTLAEEKKDIHDIEPQIELDEEDDSPIEEVRVTVTNTDDPSLPYNTFRMWFLGLAFTAIISFVNEFFYLRQTTVSIGYSVVALISLPLGHLMARFLPTRQFNLFGWRFSLNPGPFSIKEHVLIGTMAACNSSTAYAVDIVILQNVFYGDHKPFVAGLFLVLTTQITGFALAGVIRRFLVRPAHMIWPATLYVHWPVLLAATSNMPPALPYMYTNGLFLGFVFAFLLRRYRYDWWSRYNYLTSAAFDTGVAVSALVIFFALQSSNIAFPNWWGNPEDEIFDHCEKGGLPHLQGYGINLEPRDSYNEKDIKDYGDYREQGSIELSEDESDSPIEEVRVTISNRDDPSTPYNTFRMWFLGLIFTAIISFVNQFFYLRQTSISIGYSIVALLSLPLGHFLARVLPTRRFRIPLLFCLPTSRYGFSFTLNPGPFSIKEHVLIGTMAACNTSTAYAVDIVILQKVFYHDEKPFLAGLLLVLTTQITGFAIAGALRRFLVRPSQMVWPSTLVTASLFRGLHARQGSSNAPPSPHIDQEVEWLKLVHWPVLFAATSNMPPALPYFYSNGLLIGFVFAFLLRRYRYPWWSRYNYLTSAALDTGVALAGLVIFFVIQAPGLEFPHWWGNPDTSQPDVSLDHCAYGGRNFYGHAG